MKSGSKWHSSVPYQLQRSRSWNRAIVRKLLPIAMCVISLATYSDTLRFGFVYDDNSQIVANPQIKSWRFLPQIISTDVWSQKREEHIATYYRPLFSIWLLVLHSLAGLTAWFWHLSNIILNTLVSCLVLRIGLIFLDSIEAAGFASLLFSVHPIHVETVSWVSAADELIYSAFFLSSLLAFIRYLDLPDEDRSKRFVLAFGLALWTAALFSKETAVALS